MTFKKADKYFRPHEIQKKKMYFLIDFLAFLYNPFYHNFLAECSLPYSQDILLHPLP